MNPKEFSGDLFFILRNAKKKILAIGCLKDIRLKFLGEIYNIKGVRGIVSLVERKGYGKKIMHVIKKTVKNNTAVGFCARKNSSFYRKCGFKIAKNGIARFVYRRKRKIRNGEEDYDSDVLYLNGKDNFIKEFLKNKKQDVKIYKPHWWGKENQIKIFRPLRKLRGE